MANQFIQYFERSFKQHWDLPAMTNYVTKQTYAYKDVAREVAKLHILFRELNIQQDDKIALVGNNTPEWAITFLATITYGAVIVPILQDFHPDDIAHIIEHSESKLLFVEDSYWDRLEVKEVSSLRAIFSLSDFRCMRQAQGETLHIIMRQLPALFKERFPQGLQQKDIQYAQKGDQELCVLNYTSGTTGFSKGVMLKGDNFCCILEYLESNDLGHKEHKLLSILPLSHMFGCLFDLILPMKVGASVTYMSRMPSQKILVEALQEVKPSHIIIVPLVLETIFRKQILPLLSNPSIKWMTKVPILSQIVYAKIRKQLYDAFGGVYEQMFVGGAALNREVEDFLVKIKFPFTIGYGMTECAPLISLDCYHFTPHSVGTVMNNIQVRIDSENQFKEPGEILVKGRNVMMGYYKNLEATKDSFTEDGWFRTGDLGALDKNNNLYLRGRLKSMILTATGQNIYPEEIESKINSLPEVLESVIIQKNDKLIALVYPDYSAISKDMNADGKLKWLVNIRRQINSKCAKYEFVSEVKLSSSPFEKTPKNSIKRYLYEK